MAEAPLPATVTIRAGNSLLQGTPRLPGSKYATVRAVLAAALADGVSMVDGIALSDDTTVLLRALEQCGVAVEHLGPERIRVSGCAGRFPAAKQGGPVRIDAGNAGAVLRLMLGIAATMPDVRFTTSYTASLGTRPNAELLDALRQLGVDVEANGPEGRLPITLRGGGLRGGSVTIAGSRSSQYLSALLFLAPLIGEDVTIAVADTLASAGFVRLTLATLAQAGIVVEHDDTLLRFHVAGGQRYQPREWQLPRDDPSAATWLAAGSVAGGDLTLEGLATASSEGESILATLRAMGADITATQATDPALRTLTVRGTTLHGATLNGEPVIDSVPVLAAAACFAEGTTIFEHVTNLRLKESNRIDALCAELCRAGAEAIAGPDTITIVGRPEGIAGGVTVDAHEDHRLAMALAIVALRARDGLTITSAHHVAKSYPTFWEELARLGAEVTAI
jgi:3-phosphoshikimate 1-carboxyvinyltransferase